MKLTKNFTEKEFVCKCKNCNRIPDLYLINIRNLAKILQIIREEIGTPIIINSGIRCKEHNKRVGGVEDSQHLIGFAADIRSNYLTPVQLKNKILELEKEKKIYIGYIKLYNTFLHIDIRKIYTSNYYIKTSQIRLKK